MKKRLLSLATVVLFMSCFQKDPKKQVQSPPGYDLSAPEKLLLDEDLDEVSGIQYLEADSTIIALNDEEGKLYILNRKGKKMGKAFKFAKKGDFEDIAHAGPYWYAIKSNGEVTRISNAFTDSSTTTVYPFSEQGWEFETIYQDSKRDKLVALSKIPPQLDSGRVPAFMLDTATSAFIADRHSSPDTNAIRSLLQKKNTEFKPTAAAIHPVTGELYILSAKDRMLVVMRDGNTTAAYKLEKDMFRQPEGLCFMPDGTMLISNEAQEGTANILVFRYIRSH
jgi:uncharacterized protein YjiK